MNSLIDDRAMEDDEDDVSFDEETGEVKSGRRNGENGFDDSSEEDDDDDEEEEQRVSGRQLSQRYAANRSHRYGKASL